MTNNDKNEDYPLVSCIALAGNHTISGVRDTIDQFNAQSYPYKELIIVNNCRNQSYASDLVLEASPNIFIIDTPKLLSAGMARNWGVMSANGQILAQFDINYWHSPDRLQSQVNSLTAGAHISLLSNILAYSGFSNIVRYLDNDRSAILNTMVYIRPKDIDYDDVESNEESSIIQKMISKGFKPIAIDAPELCCKISMPDDYKAENFSKIQWPKDISKQTAALVKSIILNYRQGSLK